MRRRHAPCVAPEAAAWSADEVRDHEAVLPSLLRFLHALLSDYHQSFAATLDEQLGVLKEVAAAYFAL